MLTDKTVEFWKPTIVNGDWRDNGQSQA